MRTIHRILRSWPVSRMVPCFRCEILAALMVMVAAGACGQSHAVPGPNDFTGFSRFITDRNIFDPNRVAHNSSSRRSFFRRTPRSVRAPSVELVGTMSYDKGMFAFFSGDSEEMSQVLQTGGKLQGYAITAITPDAVLMESPDKKENVEMRIGDGLRQENSKWVFFKSGDMPAETATSTDTSAAAPAESSTDSTAAPSTPASAPEQNDVLKRLMEQRAKENQ